MSVTEGRLRACLVLSAAVLFLLVAGPSSSGAAVSAEGFPVATAAENETSAAVSGNTAVWSISRSGGAGMDIQGKNLSTGAALNLPTATGPQEWPDVSGRIVVWEDASGGDSDIYRLDLASGQKFPVAVGPSDQRRPSISGRTVVWEDNRNGNWDIYSFDLETRLESPVTEAPGDQRSPDVGGDTVVWEERGSGDSDVVAKSLTTDREMTVAAGDNTWQDSPVVSGDTVVWHEDAGDANFGDVFGHDLGTGQRFPVAEGAGDQHSPDVNGRVAVWATDPVGPADDQIYGKDLSLSADEPNAPSPFAVASGSAQQVNPVVSGETVVWEAQRPGTYDLLGARLDLAPAAPAGLTATGSASGVALDWATSPEPDLRGYNVYKFASEGGRPVKLNTSGPISASSYKDSQATKGVRSFYGVVAVDAAGSESAAARASAVVPKATQITLLASPTLVDHLVPASSATLSGRLASDELPVAGKKVVIEGKPLGSGSFAPVAGGEITTDTAGTFSLAGLRPEKNTEYRARFDTDAEELQSAMSQAVTVEVKQLVNTSFSTTRVKLGRSLRVTGTVFPASTGSVTLKIARNGVPLTRINNVPVQSSRFSLPYKPPAKGVYTVEVALDGYPQHLVTPSIGTFKVTLR